MSDLEKEELYYLGSENKGADQLRGYREADLRLCFRICRLLVFSRGGAVVFVEKSGLFNSIEVLVELLRVMLSKTSP